MADVQDYCAMLQSAPEEASRRRPRGRGVHLPRGLRLWGKAGQNPGYGGTIRAVAVRISPEC